MSDSLMDSAISYLESESTKIQIQAVRLAIEACTTSQMIDGCRESVCKVSALNDYIELQLTTKEQQ